MGAWLEEHEHLLEAAAISAIVLSAISVIVVPLLIALLPSDYFLGDEAPEMRWQRAHPLARRTLRVLRNLLGVLLVIAGVVMLVLPGQGLLTMLVGLGLVEFPGKRRAEVWFVSRRGVLRALNWIRARARRPPLAVGDPGLR
jgi:hypothetical protein